MHYTIGGRVLGVGSSADTAEVTMQITAFDVAIHVEPPPPDEVVDLPLDLPGVFGAPSVRFPPDAEVPSGHGSRRAVGRGGACSISSTGSTATAPRPTRSGRSGSSTRSRRSRPTATRRWCSRCSATRPTSGSWRSAPTSPGCRRSSRSCSAAPLVPVDSYRLAHRALGVHRRPKTTSGSASRPTRASTGAELEARLARVARAHRSTTASNGCTRSCRASSSICFYPMSKRRDGDANWYELPFEERKQLMAGHARVGRTLRRPGAPAHHRLDRDRRLGVGRHAARRRPGRAEGDRLRDALRRRCPRATREFGPFFTGLVLEPADALAASA